MNDMVDMENKTATVTNTDVASGKKKKAPRKRGTPLYLPRAGLLSEIGRGAPMGHWVTGL